MDKFFTYKNISQEQIDELLMLEPKLSQYVDFTKSFSIRIMKDHYQCFLHSVISQQLNSAAVDTIWNRLVNSVKKVEPKYVSELSMDQLRAIGLSQQKISLIKKMSYDIIDKKINLHKLEKLSNEEINEVLTQYKFLGKWTVDMLLIFTYYRNDVFPIEDFGIKNGLKKLYGEININEEYIKYIKNKFKAYTTLFSFCLWRINNGN